MRRSVIFVPVLGLLLAACTQPDASSPPPVATSLSAPMVSPSASVPPAPEPTGAGPCPYLTSDFVAQANGQRVSKVQTSADQPHPACFFYTLNGKLQLTVRVYVGDAAVAKALVDQVAPVDTSNPAAEPAGWHGGYQKIDTGALYAVSKDGVAVVVTTNQEQSVKARTVAKQAIAGLKL